MAQDLMDSVMPESPTQMESDSSDGILTGMASKFMKTVSWGVITLTALGGAAFVVSKASNRLGVSKDGVDSLSSRIDGGF